MKRIAYLFILLSIMFPFYSVSTTQAGNTAICYNCPPEWADWASQLKAIKANLGLDVPHDNKNSGQTLSQLIAEKDNPVADVAYYGVTFWNFGKAKRRCFCLQAC